MYPSKDSFGEMTGREEEVSCYINVQSLLSFCCMLYEDVGDKAAFMYGIRYSSTG